MPDLVNPVARTLPLVSSPRSADPPHCPGDPNPCPPAGCFCLGTPPQLCAVTISYPQGKPETPIIDVPTIPQCAGVEIALAVMLAQLLKGE